MMKYSRIVVMVIAAFVLITQSCRKKDLQPGVAPISIIAKVTYADAAYAFPLSGVKVRLENANTLSLLQMNTDANGLAVFGSVNSGVYNLSATVTIAKALYESVTGLTTNRDSVTFNASISNATLNATTNNTINLVLETGQIGDWVLKQIYYAGSNTTNGALFRDQFLEIYNNSNDTLYADSLYISQAVGSNTVNPDYTTGKFINDGGAFQGQWDWSKSIGMTMGATAVTNYWYAKSIFRIPSNAQGNRFPVLPGRSIIIAATALNHKAPYTSTTGTAININDPSLTVDLREANFEVYLGGIISNPLNTDIDNPAVTNVDVIATGGNRDLILDNPGRDAIVLFKTTVDLPLYTSTTAGGYPKYPNPTVTTITSSTDLYYQIPNSVIIDAVQVQHAVPASRVPRKLAMSSDAGANNVPAGQYSSQSLIRKTSATVGTRKVMMDTNNSSNDFNYLDRALPGSFSGRKALGRKLF